MDSEVSRTCEKFDIVGIKRTVRDREVVPFIAELSRAKRAQRSTMGKKIW